MLSERISSYGYTREVWRARKKRKSYALSSSSFLSALQISQVHHVAKKNTYLLIVNLILVTRGIKKNKPLYWLVTNTPQQSSLKEMIFGKPDRKNFLIYSLTINRSYAETKVKES